MLEKKTKSACLIVPNKNSQDQIAKRPLRELIKKSLRYYLLNCKHECLNNLYALALAELEQPLLDMIMQHTRGNQTRASSIMGINRSTLRKKLKKYGMN
ncbi:DNA-binding transcriptional regulator Fis [Buchnera aphidicola (Hyadaphis tataricae)]|uniref:Putative Fis-like DNA-binding protein n=1 Tax=Buchnera aphidicola (Hyadaphis tataricae) TaxID=1241859 RepID=A0A4D6Y6J7_9GAMM|nr:DNA-binding transcriptional regulator Fis [Buchnera aphidicola]QCI21691.1 DNA-binding transcriptional regulator Fis [Buchnera aphidicola (Hyadaphis tataricae)]